SDFGCGEGEVCCGGRCTDIQTDVANCGDCGTACAAGQVCCNRTCAGCCSDVDCGEGCDSCHNGQCVANGQLCPPCQACNGQTLRCEPRPNGDPDPRCPAGQTCQGGVCACPTGHTLFLLAGFAVGPTSFAEPSAQATLCCPSGQSPCGEVCVDLQTDAA